jgi:ElaB/YqjD/DUF883 family membrane-anchored ribosome-binding protein
METGNTQKQTIDRLSQTAHQGVDRAATAANAVAERFGEKADQWMDLQETWVEGARDYVREHPFAALGIAVAAGYLFSLLARGR